MAVADHRQARQTELSDLLDELDGMLRSGDESALRGVPTGFPVLDDTLGGGLRTGELVLLGGAPGIGKTIMALQMARDIAARGEPVLYVSYEHEATTLATRLLALEAAALGASDPTGTRIATALGQAAHAHRGLDEAIADSPVLADAVAAMRTYADRLTFVRASGTHTALASLNFLVEAHASFGPRPVVFLDYLQKIPVQPDPPTEAEKVTRTVEGLKDLALDHRVPVLAVSAVDTDGLHAARLRLHHLRGSSAVAFEADVVLMLNEKHRAVSKVHLSYDPVRARGFRNWVVLSVEKNRGGPALVDLEFRKDFAHFRFDPDGQLVGETLADERVDDSGL